VEKEPHHYGALARLARNLRAEAELKKREGEPEAWQRLRVEALGFYDEALRREPLQPDVLLDAARLRLSMQREERIALEQLDKAVRLWPKHREAHNNRAVAYLRLGIMAKEGGDAGSSGQLLNDALAATNDALEVFPRYAKALANQAYVYWQMGRLDDALAAAQKAREVNPAYRFNEQFQQALAEHGMTLPPPNRPTAPPEKR
jgi:tetratricopeptide (TPR) repeat protein